MARTGRIKPDADTYFHIMSRTAGRQYLLQEEKYKEMMLDALERAAAFSGVEVYGFCIMDDHFHILCLVPRIDAGTVPDKEVLERVGKVKGAEGMARLEKRLENFRKSGDMAAYSAELDRYRARMYDLSQFVKTFKEIFGIRFRRETGYSGHVWGERFKSVIVENARQLAVCMKYIEHNPVRAGMTARENDYAWNTSGAAAKGMVFARACMQKWNLQDIDEEESPVWIGKRCAQISSGKIIGGKQFVEETIGRHEDKLKSRRLKAREFVSGICSSHGHRLAKEAA